MFERYTDEAKKAIFFAHVEAVHRNEQSISVRDLLIGLTWESQSVACTIGSLKKNAVELQSSVSVPHLPITSLPYMRKADIPLDGDAKKAVAYAAKEADHDRQYWIDSDHLLRALLRFPNDAANALLSTGVQLQALRSASALHRKEFPLPPVPKGARLKTILRKYWLRGLIAALLLIIFAYLKSQS